MIPLIFICALDWTGACPRPITQKDNMISHIPAHVEVIRDSKAWYPAGTSAPEHHDTYLAINYINGGYIGIPCNEGINPLPEEVTKMLEEQHLSNIKIVDGNAAICLEAERVYGVDTSPRVDAKEFEASEVKYGYKQ